MALEILNAGTIKRIHVNQHVIKRNLKHGEEEPPITVKNRGRTYRAHQVDIHGESTVVHSPDQPLSCGARVWVETKAEVFVYG